MGRNKKVGLDWFGLDVTMDTKVELLEAEYGLKGFAVFVKLLQRIYGGDGYYCEWNEEVELLFSRRINEGRSFVSEVVQAAIKRGIFDREKFEKFGILTSRGIQKRFFDAVERRKEIEVVNEYLLVHGDQNFKNVSIKAINANINNENADKKRQRKGKESRGKESRVYMHDAGQADTVPAPFAEIILNDGSFYPVSHEDVRMWAELYPAVDVPGEIRKMVGWCDANPAKRKTAKGVRRFINNWLSKEQDKCGTKQQHKQPQSETSQKRSDAYDDLDEADARWLLDLYGEEEQDG